MSLVCPACGQANADNARFCKNCGLALPRSCPNCGQSVSAGARFCQHCSHSLTGPIVPGLTGRLNPQTVLAGRYVIVRLLGKGGMGAVYLADDMRLGNQQWAIKEMSDQAISDPDERQTAVEAFNKEAELLARLEHPNLPKVIDRFSEQGNQFLAMEFVPGQTLEKRLETAYGPLPEAEVRSYVEQLCDVLAYLHSQKPPIIFRDLKPANIMARPDGRLKLIDFGIARHFKPGKAKDTQAMGTPGYAAPEQYGKGQSDARADIYALGATMHHMLTGRDPGQEPFKFPPVRALNNAVPPPLEDVVMRAVQMDVAQRWQSVRDLQDALTTKPPAAAPAVAVVALPPPVSLPPVNVMPPAPVATAKPKSPAPPAGLGDIKRAGLVWFLIVTVGIGVFLASPLLQDMVIEISASIGYWLGLPIFIATCTLAYLLTHRPGAIACVAVTAVVGSLNVFSGGLSLNDVIFSVGVELALALSLWRTRNLFALWLACMVGMMAWIFLFGGGWFYSFEDLALTGGSLFVALIAALIISAMVNSITGIGRQP